MTNAGPVLTTALRVKLKVSLDQFRKYNFSIWKKKLSSATSAVVIAYCMASAIRLHGFGIKMDKCTRAQECRF